MAQNVVVTSETANSFIQTTCRPIIVEFSHVAASTPSSAMLQIQVQIYQGAEIVDAGQSLVVTRDPSSTTSSPKFTVDISSLLKSYITSADYIDGVDSIFSQGNTDLINLLPSTNTTVDYLHSNFIKYRVSVRSYYLSQEGLLTLNEDDDPVTNSDRYACDIYIKDENLSETIYANLPTD